jgi:8-oxo-dGTP pyrophosphatase MutT (NUDIX family)
MAQDAPTRTAKAYGYVVRTDADGRTVDAEADDDELLVFEEDGVSAVQVPKGSIEAGEDPHTAVRREVREEAGLTEFESVEHLTTDEWPHPRKEKVYVRHFFRIDVMDVPDEWRHTVTGEGEDVGDVYEYFWLPLPPTRPVADGMDDHVDRL